MKKIILLLVLAISTNAISQEIKVIDANGSYTGNNINTNDDNINLRNVFYVNGNLIKNLNDIKRVNPKAIEVFNVEKGEYIVDGVIYQSKISIKTYQEYTDNFLLPEEDYRLLQKPTKLVAKKL